MKAPTQIEPRVKRLAFALVASAALAAPAGTLAASTPNHGWDSHCGSQNQPGFGWYNVKAYNTSCDVARKRVARHYKKSHEDEHFNGWTCRDHQTGSEVSEVNCTRRHDGHHQHVRFEYGS